MSFTESILAYTTRIEKLLGELGGTGNGMIEKAKTLPILPKSMVADLRKIAWVRNRIVHDHGYRFTGSEDSLFGLCERVLADLSKLLQRKASAPREGQPDRKASSQPKSAPFSSSPTSGTRSAPPDKVVRPNGIDSMGGSSGLAEPKPSETIAIPTGSNGGNDFAPISLAPWVVSLATAILCWKILPHFFVRTVETGFWIFKSSHQEIVWEVVGILSIGGGLVSFFVTRAWLGRKR